MLENKEINGLPGESISGGTSKKERECLYHLAAGVREGEIVEIGSFYGGSTIYLAEGAKRSNKKVYAVDPFLGGTELGKAFMTNIKKAKCEDIVTPLNMTSQEAAKSWNRPVGLLFIDALHDYVNVKNDFIWWRKHLVPSHGIVVFHDIWGLGVIKVIHEKCLPDQFCNLQICQSLLWVRTAPELSFKGRIKHHLCVTFILLVAWSLFLPEIVMRRLGWKFRFRIYAIVKKLLLHSGRKYHQIL